MAGFVRSSAGSLADSLPDSFGSMGSYCYAEDAPLVKQSELSPKSDDGDSAAKGAACSESPRSESSAGSAFLFADMPLSCRDLPIGHPTAGYETDAENIGIFVRSFGFDFSPSQIKSFIEENKMTTMQLGFLEQARNKEQVMSLLRSFGVKISAGDTDLISQL